MGGLECDVWVGAVLGMRQWLGGGGCVCMCVCVMNYVRGLGAGGGWAADLPRL